MAKKARRRLEEAEEEQFEFPPFDERGFLDHEFELYYATVIAFIVGVVLGLVGFLVDGLGLSVVVPLLVGLAGTAAGVLIIQRIRPGSRTYTTGDWAGLVVLIFFGFLGFWLLFADLFRAVGVS